MNHYEIKYWVNELSGTGKLLMRERYVVLTTDIEEEAELIEFTKVEISRLEKVPRNEIKLGSFSKR